MVRVIGIDHLAIRVGAKLLCRLCPDPDGLKLEAMYCAETEARRARIARDKAAADTSGSV